MSVKLYYFSGTGNSLVLAREFAKRLDAEIFSIPKVLNDGGIVIDAEKIGIIIPSYMAAVAGMPLIVERFIKQIVNIESLHIFTVCSCGGYECVNALPSIHKLREVIKSCGGHLSEEFTIRLPMNNLDYDHIPVPIIRDSEVIIRRSNKKINRIYHRLIHNKGARFRLIKELFYLLMTPFFKMMQKPVLKGLKEKAKVPAEADCTYYELMPMTDKSIVVDEKCRGCGTCAKVCPVHNIIMKEKRPEFTHHCEICFACDEWCPAGAIQHWSRAAGIKYHHPEVKLSDFIE
jgi:ferredoxin/flavodoxin